MRANGAQLALRERRGGCSVGYMLCCTCEVNRIFAAVQHAVGRQVSAAAWLPIQPRFIDFSPACL